MVGRREHFLKSNFESLSGGLNDERDHAAAINNSISNKYKSGALSDHKGLPFIPTSHPYRTRGLKIFFGE